jgi:hypothetical protein
VGSSISAAEAGIQRPVRDALKRVGVSDRSRLLFMALQDAGGTTVSTLDRSSWMCLCCTRAVALFVEKAQSPSLRGTRGQPGPIDRFPQRRQDAISTCALLGVLPAYRRPWRCGAAQTSGFARNHWV